MIVEPGSSLIIQENILVIFLPYNFSLLMEVYDSLTQGSKEKHSGCDIYVPNLEDLEVHGKL